MFRWLRHWHARIGVVAALFFLFLVLSGIALNHTDALKLTERKLGASWLTRWYGLRAEVPARGFALGSRFLTWDAQQWALDAQVIATRQAQPVGAVRAGDVVFIATRDALHLYAADGNLIDKVSGEALPALPLERLGVDRERVVVGTARGNFASSDGIEWAPLPSAPEWSTPSAPPAALVPALRTLYAPSIDSERVLLDLHSGRIFGRYGPIVVDLAALALLALALSGVWMYLRARRLLARTKEHRR